VGKPSLYAAQPYAKTEGRVFLLVPAYPGCPGTKAVKRLLLLLLSVVYLLFDVVVEYLQLILAMFSILLVIYT